jgi:hypothetical protein
MCATHGTISSYQRTTQHRRFNNEPEFNQQTSDKVQGKCQLHDICCYSSASRAMNYIAIRCAEIPPLHRHFPRLWPCKPPPDEMQPLFPRAIFLSHELSLETHANFGKTSFKSKELFQIKDPQFVLIFSFFNAFSSVPAVVLSKRWAD